MWRGQPGSRQLRIWSQSRVGPSRVITVRLATVADQSGPPQPGQERVSVFSSMVRSAGGRAVLRGMGHLLGASSTPRSNGFADLNQTDFAGLVFPARIVIDYYRYFAGKSAHGLVLPEGFYETIPAQHAYAPSRDLGFWHCVG